MNRYDYSRYDYSHIQRASEHTCKDNAHSLPLTLASWQSKNTQRLNVSTHNTTNSNITRLKTV